MTGPERDTLIIGFSVGALAFLWIGYRLRVRVERWHARRAAIAQARVREHDFPRATGRPRRPPSEQNARSVLANRPQPQLIPINRFVPFDLWPGTDVKINLDPSTGVVITGMTGDPTKVDPAPIPIASRGHFETFDEADKWVAAETTRADALAALTSAGYKRPAAEAALDACTIAERAGGLESWVAAALRHATSK